MSKSGQLRLHDIRDAYRLIGDCRDLGGDPVLWHGRMLQGLAHLIDADIVTGGEGRWVRRDEAPFVGSAFAFGLDGAGQKLLRTYVKNNDVEDDPVVRAMGQIRGQLVVRTRRQLIGDPDWYRSRMFTEYLRLIHCDHQLMSICEVSEEHAISVITMHRARGRRDFSQREQSAIRLFHGELGHLIGKALVSVYDPDPLQLPRRERETLACLLEGDSEKQVAARLGLSPLTTHQYVKSLYRRFGVQSRAELLAYFLRRERGVSR